MYYYSLSYNFIDSFVNLTSYLDIFKVQNFDQLISPSETKYSYVHVIVPTYLVRYKVVLEMAIRHWSWTAMNKLMTNYRTLKIKPRT